jgi:hydroxymethylbilane synthase
MPKIRLGTRGSKLALWQANHVAALLSPFAEVEQVIIETIGDAVQDKPLSAMGGFGVFTREIQHALLQKRVDVAVHSLKDLPTLYVEGLHLAAVPERGPTGDCMLAVKFNSFAELPPGAVVGTSSLRRRAMLLNQRPDLKLIDLRGNVDTRIRKLHEGQYDAIVLAEAGLIRLGFQAEIKEVLPNRWCLPAVGQGAIGLECRADDVEVSTLLQRINHLPTWQAITAERAMLSALGGGCLVPMGVVSTHAADDLHLRAVVLSTDGTRRITAESQGPANKPLLLGTSLAADLATSGARELLIGEL